MLTGVDKHRTVIGADATKNELIGECVDGNGEEWHAAHNHTLRAVSRRVPVAWQENSTWSTGRDWVQSDDQATIIT